LGALLLGFFADPAMNPNLNLNLKDVVGQTLWIEQLKAMGLTIVLAVVATCILGYALKATIGLRPSEEDEVTGLDLSDHGERGYHSGEIA
jgi:Amt family ammonium transporter